MALDYPISPLFETASPRYRRYPSGPYIQEFTRRKIE
jgi:hypothetical protein